MNLFILILLLLLFLHEETTDYSQTVVNIHWLCVILSVIYIVGHYARMSFSLLLYLPTSVLKLPTYDLLTYIATYLSTCDLPIYQNIYLTHAHTCNVNEGPGGLIHRAHSRLWLFVFFFQLFLFFFCLIGKSPCISSPCQNGGQCEGLNDNEAFQCTCTSDWQGDVCEIGKNKNIQFMQCPLLFT